MGAVIDLTANSKERMCADTPVIARDEMSAQCEIVWAPGDEG
jgi:hypothetical protein